MYHEKSNFIHIWQLTEMFASQRITIHDNIRKLVYQALFKERTIWQNIDENLIISFHFVAWMRSDYMPGKHEMCLFTFFSFFFFFFFQCNCYGPWNVYISLFLFLLVKDVEKRQNELFCTTRIDLRKGVNVVSQRWQTKEGYQW